LTHRREEEEEDADEVRGWDEEEAGDIEYDRSIFTGEVDSMVMYS